MPQEAIDAANTLGAKVDRLTASVDQLSTSVKRGRIVTVVLSMVCLVILGLVIAVVVNVRYSAHQATCVRDYVNQNADRSKSLTPIFFAKVTADGAYLRADRSKDQALKDRLYEAMLKADEAYDRAFFAAPLPQAPRYNC